MADYGLDAPREVRRFVTRGLALIGVAVVMSLTNASGAAPLISIAISIGVSFLFAAAVMVWSSRFGKLKLRDRVLDRLQWRGDEQVLDVGCGRGLFLIGAAKRLTSGKAVGVDIWSEVDQSGNKPEATLRNAQDEGVSAKIKIENGDARKLPFTSSSFDKVVSSLAIHNIPSKEDRAKAVAEIARVLKPGGAVAILDIFHTGDYADELRRLGFKDVELSRVSLYWCVPTRYLTAHKS
jgi:arsenite methyltransferase